MYYRAIESYADDKKSHNEAMAKMASDRAERLRNNKKKV
jgi:hypothetical protein